MKAKNVKKVLALILAASMSVGLLTACGNGASSTEEASQSENAPVSEATQSNEAASSSEASQTAESSVAADAFEHDPLLNELGVEPFCKEEVTITIGIKQNANVMDYKDNHYTRLLEEGGNVNLEFLMLPSKTQEAKEKLQMMIAGGEKLPDILCVNLGDAWAQELGAEGYLVPLEDYFENSAYYSAMVIEEAQVDRGVNVLQYMTMPDGHIWSFPTYYEAPSNAVYAKLHIYQPWLDALNLEVPTTTEELYEVLKAFKSQDPNGNGKADEIPLLGTAPAEDVTGAWAWEAIMNAFVPSTSRKDFLNSTDGQLSFSFDQDGWKQGVQYINKLVSEGLFDPVSFTQNEESFKAIMSGSGDQLVGMFCYFSPDFLPVDHPSRENWTALTPITGPDGVCATAWQAVMPSNCAYITADCEHPEIAFRVLDLMTREDITITARWGEQGVHWDYAENLKNNKEWLEAHPEFKEKDWDFTYMGYPALFYEYETCWNQPNKTHWMNAGVAMRTQRVVCGYYACQADTEALAIESEVQAAYEAVKPKEVMTRIVWPDAETDAEMAIVMENIKAYVFEKLSQWCTGSADVEAEWDAYLKELEALGAYEYLEIAQQGWTP